MASFPSDDSNNRDDNTSTQGQPPSWKLEESSLWWLSLDIWKNPGNVLLISSIPFCAGAYLGYKKPSKRLEQLAGKGDSNGGSVDKQFGSLNDRRRLGLQTAARALRLATLGTVGVFGMLGAGKSFYIV